MDLHTALILAQGEIARWPQLSGWRVEVSSRSRRALGRCFYRTTTIQLSLDHVLLNEAAKVRGTVLHEIAHALVGPGHGHDRVWRDMAVLVGAEPVRCAYGVTLPPGKWMAVCPSCGGEFHLFRRPKADRLRWCRACGPRRGLLEYIPNVP